MNIKLPKITRILLLGSMEYHCRGWRPWQPLEKSPTKVKLDIIADEQKHSKSLQKIAKYYWFSSRYHRTPIDFTILDNVGLIGAGSASKPIGGRSHSIRYKMTSSIYMTIYTIDSNYFLTDWNIITIKIPITISIWT